jgi:hypothetical protein
MHSKTHNDLPGFQTAISSFQVQLSVKSNAPGDGEMKQWHGDAVYDKCSHMNMAAEVNNDKLQHLSEKVTNRRWMVCITPSLTNKKRGAPVTQGPTCSKTCNEHETGPQMAVDPHHREVMSSSCIQWIEGSRDGSYTQQDGGAGNRRRSNSNVKHKKKLTSLSVKSVQE